MRAVIVFLSLILVEVILVKTSAKCTTLSLKQFQRAEQAARQWAPHVWLAPGERFFPSSALDFLSYTRTRSAAVPVDASADTENLIRANLKLNEILPEGISSRNQFLETYQDVETLLSNTSSFLYGHSPVFYSVPVYAVVNTCCSKLRVPSRDFKMQLPQASVSINDVPIESETSTPTLKNNTDADLIDFEVTYWLFFPYSEGKKFCTVNAGALGPLPIPWLRRSCLGKIRTFGNHVGDWEHVTIAFKSTGAPIAMYVSTHEAGALYSPPKVGVETEQLDSRRFWTYAGQELRRGSRLQNPKFPRRAFTMPSGRPVLFAAKGSHGLWTQPGRHKYVTFPNIEDETGFGAEWLTWQNLQIISWPPSKSDPQWIKFEGHWGNPRSGCHPLSQQVCQYSDGPQGIPTKKHAFRCLNTLPPILLKQIINNELPLPYQAVSIRTSTTY